MKTKKQITRQRSLLVWAAAAAALLSAAALPLTFGRQQAGASAPLSRLTIAREQAAQAPLLDTDLALTKTATLEPAIAGDPLGYNLNIHNQGVLTATGVTLTDTLPLSLTFTGASPSCSYLLLTRQVFCNLASLSPGASAQLTITTVVDPALQGDLINQAVVTHDSLDPDPLNNTALLTTTVQAEADLALEKLGAPDPVTAGELLFYTLTVTNNGPSNLTGAVLTDTLPTGVIFNSASAGCAPVAGDVICTLGGLPTGGALPVTITVGVDPATTGILANNASVAGAEFDPDSANNTTGPVTTTVTTLADLELGNMDGPDPVTAGNLLTYTLSLVNTGPSIAQDIVLTDTLQTPEVSFVSVLPSPTCSHAAGVVSCNPGSLDPGEVFPVTLVVQVASTATGSIGNNAAASSSTPDPDGGGPIAAASTAVVSFGDLAVSILDNPDPVVAGADLTYTLTLVNNGPSLSQNISVADTLPGDVSYIDSTTTQGTCNHNTGTVLCSLGNLDTGDAATITIQVSVAPLAAGTLLNTAVATATTSDPITENNTANETTQITAFADLAVTKTGNPNPVIAGSLLTYTLNVANAGPSAADGTVVTDTLPGATTFLAATPPQGSCSESGGVVVCDLGTLGDSAALAVPLTVIVDSGAAGTTITNQVSVASSAIDPAAGDNTDSLTTTVTASADLQIQKFDTPDALPPGAVLTYTVVTHNNGPSNAATVAFTDTLPAEVSLINIIPGGGGLCAGTAVIRCDFPSLASGASADTFIIVQVNPATPTGSIVNNSLVAAATPDPNLANNFFSEATIIADEIVDLAVTISDDPDPVQPEELLTYKIDVINNGPSLATGVTVTDTLPTGVNFLQASTTQGSCTQAEPVICALGDLAAGVPVQITIDTEVRPAALGLLTNTAIVTSIEPDSNTDNNLDQEDTTVVPVADLELALADGPDPIYVSPNTGLSYELAYTLTVTNFGPSPALSVTITDTLPTGVSFLSATPGCAEQVGIVTCDLGGLPAGSSSNATILTEVDATIPISTSLINHATVSSASIDPASTNNTASASTSVIPDSEPPTFNWTLPVVDTLGYYFVDIENGHLEILRLAVNPADNSGIDRVLFKRWDYINEIWIYFATLTDEPYELDFDTSILLPQENELRAEVYDFAGNMNVFISEGEMRSNIWLYRGPYSSAIYLPLVKH